MDHSGRKCCVNFINMRRKLYYSCGLSRVVIMLVHRSLIVEEVSDANS